MHLKALCELRDTIDRFEPLLERVDAGGQMLLDCLRSGGKVLSCGNGGSAADALHLAEEFVGRYRGNRRALPAVCLAADVTALTCIGNDFGFEAVFSRQVEGLGNAGDVLVAFTTSGNSANVVKALEAACSGGLKTILLAGKDGGKSKGVADIEIIVPHNDSARIQELHTFVLHQWLEMVEQQNW